MLPLESPDRIHVTFDDRRLVRYRPSQRDSVEGPMP